MRISRAILLTTITSVFTFSAFSQIPAGTIMASGYYATVSPMSDRAAAEEYINGIKTVYYGQSGPQQVDGSPFLSDNFLPGEIGFIDSAKLVDITLRYNIYMDQMQVIFNNDTLSVQPSYLLKYIRLADQYFIFSLIYDKSTRKFSKGYFEILADGEYKLLKQYKRPLLYDSYATNYNSGGGTKRYFFGSETALYYKKGEEAAIKIGRTEKQVVKIFPPEKQEKITQFIEEKELQVRKQEDLIKLLNFLNEI